MRLHVMLNLMTTYYRHLSNLRKEVIQNKTPRFHVPVTGREVENALFQQRPLPRHPGVLEYGLIGAKERANLPAANSEEKRARKLLNHSLKLSPFFRKTLFKQFIIEIKWPVRLDTEWLCTSYFSSVFFTLMKLVFYAWISRQWLSMILHLGWVSLFWRLGELMVNDTLLICCTALFLD